MSHVSERVAPPDRARAVRALPLALRLAIGAVAAAAAWWMTTPGMLVGLDWDNAFHHWQIDHMIAVGRDGCGYGRTLWTCGYTAHMALEPLYGAGALAARWWNGGVLDGMRLVNALAIGAAAAALAATLRYAGTALWGALLVASAWVLTSDVTFLVRTVEDDCLLLAWTAILLLLCVQGRSRWNAAFAGAVGAVLAAGALTNYALLVWAPVLIAAALVYVRSDVGLLDPRRALWLAATAGGFALVIAVWGAWLHAYDGDRWTWTRYAQVLATPANDLSGRSGTLDGLLRYVALCPLDTLLPPGWYPRPWLEADPLRWRTAGILLVAVVLIGVVWPMRRGPRTATSAAALTSLSFLALAVCSLPAAWKGDYAHYERLDHVPLCLAVLAGAALSISARRSSNVARIATMAVLVVVALVNGVALAQAPRSQSWLAKFDAARRAHPDARTFVYAESEFEPQDFDKLESLRMAMPAHIVISPDGAIRKWPFTPVTHMMVADYASAPADRPLLSAAAADLLAAGPPH